MEQPTPLTDAQRFNDLTENGNPIHVLNVIKDECDRLQFSLRHNCGVNQLTESESLNLLRAARHLYTQMMPAVRRIREAERVKK